ncbi:MAG: zinc ribbon domain-containing protein [Eubacterium sp.]|nr:zinc ribbon domain-containing protein [Eubacterium sp.]
MKKCNNCGQTYDEEMNFCPQCGGTIEKIIETVEETNTVCPNCNSVIDNSSASFCSFCGASLAEEKDILCPNCNAVIEDKNASFCHICGAKINGDTVKQEATVQSFVKNAADKVRENEFVKSVKQDIENSQSLNILKDKAKEGFNSAVDMAKGASQNVKSMDPAKKKKTGVIAAVIAALIVVLLVVTNIHNCEECGKTYIGKNYTISFWGETEKVCKECYNDFYYNW